MVSDKLKREYLGILSDTDPMTVRAISKKLDKADGRVRLTLKAMQDLGMVKQVDLPKPNRNQCRGARKGWVRLFSFPP